MASVQALRRRIKSVQSTAKICRAMEMLATAKLKRTQEQALAGRPYTEKISQVIADLAAKPQLDIETPPLLQRPEEIKKIALVHISSDRGLCGGLNANLNRALAKFILDLKTPVTMITVGRRSRAFSRHTGLSVRAEFSGISDQASIRETISISRVVIDDYCQGDVDLVYLAYPRFITTMRQEPTIEALLPVEPAAASAASGGDYIFEPNPTVVLNELLPRYVEMRLYHAVLELIASEQSARMVAMRNASDNAKNVTEDLTLTLNKARQENITKEICDICGGTEALKAS